MPILKKKIALSVSEFALPAPNTGSIDIYSGFSQGQEVGSQLHKEIQEEHKKIDCSYYPEVFTMHTLKFKNYIFEISGRMDGIYRKEKVKIEEIKTAFDLKRLHHYLKNSHMEHPFWLQLQTYGYFHWLKTEDIPELNLCLVSQRDKKIINLPYILNIACYEKWLKRRYNALIKEIKDAKIRIKKRQKMASLLTFPFKTQRNGQKELITTIKNKIKTKTSFLIQAPTGLGKTIGIVYPMLFDAMARGQKLIYITPKNSQHQVAYDAVEKLQQNDVNLSSIILTAKKKLCLKAEQLCNREYCEFASNHYEKVTKNKLLDKVKEKNNLTHDFFREIGKEYQICPYELQMDSIPFIDIVICDYNYVFAPHSLSSRVSKINLGENQKPNLVIDEVHNLPARAMDYYSPILSVTFFENLYHKANSISLKFQEELKRLLHECIFIIKNCKIPHIKNSHKITISKKTFNNHEIKLKEFLNTYLASDIEIAPHDIVLMLYNYWAEFTTILEFIDEEHEEFFIFYISDPEAIKITCCDASIFLADYYNNYKKIIGFSATLKPFNYYSQLIGLQSSNLHTQEFLSSFPKNNRKILIIPQISSKFSERQYNYARIGEVINKITAIKPGNYFIFFPSFDFLEKVLNIFIPVHNFKVISQTRNMQQLDVNDLLNKLHNKNVNHLFFAIQGGIFAEGIDYPGNLAIGAFVIGPALPMFNWEREQMKNYYEAKYKAGFDFTYTYPAMAKAVQSAGRIIRSEHDKGIIVLMDNRFLQENYSKCMPSDWYENTPQELLSQSILADVEEFWRRN